MGLILSQTVKVRIGSINYQYYKEKGYEFKKCGDIIEVNVLDLYPGSPTKVKIICDVCGKEAEVRYCRVVEYNKENKLITCGDKICKHKKTEDTNLKKYGVRNVAQSQEVQNKMKDTNLEHHGCEYPMQNEEIRNKGIQTLKEKYGEDIINISQVKEIQDKIKDTNLERYGYKIPLLNQAIREKIKNTNLERYGCKYPFESKEIRNKSEKTWQEKYGENIKCPLQVESIKDKIKATWQENYGKDITCPFQAESVKKKSKQTMLNNYGVEHAMQNEEIKNKVLDSFQFNSTGPCSRTQKYIHFLIGGVLNKRVYNSLVDICFEEEKIAIEYDGGGHFLGELMINKDRSISKEALLKEKERENRISNKGYRMIRFIATKDRIPSDEVILNLIEGFKNSDFKVIRINFEEGTIDRDYKEKWCCNFGKLRKSTKEDLEQFESKKNNKLKIREL